MASNSLWSPAAHQPDHQGYLPDAPPSPGSGRKGFNWFKRDRSASPAQASSRSRGSSRGASPHSPGGGNGPPSRNASPSFVVRNVVKRPGGVSLDTDSSSVGHVAAAHYGGGSPISDHGGHDGANLNYSRSRSRPLGAQGGLSLGVPPGGPGGGVGYGTAASSNDGRPEPYHNDGAEIPKQRSRSRGRSPSNGGEPRRPASPGAMTAGAFRAAGRISPGPLSWAQQQEIEERNRRGAPRSRDGSPAAQQQGPGQHFQAQPLQQQQNRFSGPQGPRTGPAAWGAGPQQHAQAPPAWPQEHSPRLSSPLSSSPAAPALSQDRAQAHIGPNHQLPSRISIPPGSGPPPVIPLDGVPSPIDIPRPPYASNHSAPHTPHSEGGRSGFGTPSPGASPAAHSPGLAAAGRWMKGLFGKSPQLGQKGDGDVEGMYSAEGQPINSGWGGAPPLSPGAQPTPYGIPVQGGNYAPSPTVQHQGLSPSTRKAPPRVPSEDERQAELQKKESQRAAARIIDEERRRLMEKPVGGFDPDTDKPFSPRQVVAHEEPDGTEDGFLHRQMQSPPGRKPVPRLDEIPSEEQLLNMGPDGREKVAARVDPHDALSKLEGMLTPAQQIIAETRSKHLARERAEADARARAGVSGSTMNSPQVQRGFTPATPNDSPSPVERRRPSVQRQETPEIEQPVRRQSRKSPTKPAPAPAAAGAQNATPSRTAAPGTPGAQGRGGPAPSSGLQPGHGPMPMDMSLPAALQEMMVRFYRYERYSVPLIRSLETRLLDIERDAQLAFNANDSASQLSANGREMDKWVGQMTALMKHEVSQLKAATREIREGRELLADVVKSGAANNGTGSGFLNRQRQQQQAQEATAAPQPAPAPESNSIDSLAVETGQPLRTPAGPSPLRTATTTSSNVRNEAPSPVTGHGARGTNISSASFNSAVPRKAVDSVPSSTQPANKSILELPEGSAPALDKDEGKAAHGKQVSSSSATSDGAAARAGSTSPSGRPRFTSALGQPMQNGRISPLSSREMNRSEASSSSVLEAPPAGRYDVNGAPGRAGSPSLSDAGSATSNSSAAARRRGQSIDDRLKALVSNKGSSSSLSEQALDEDEERQGEQIKNQSQRVGDDYVLVGTAATPSDERDVTLTAESPKATKTTAALNVPSKSGHAQSASTSSEATATPSRRSTLFAPVPTANPLIGGRTSPTPSSHSAHSPGAASRRSTSPSPFAPPGVPSVAGGTIKTAAHATDGLRARAQSYLQSAESTVGASSTTASAATSPVPPSPASWLSTGGAGAKSHTLSPTSPVKSSFSSSGTTAVAATTSSAKLSASPDKLVPSSIANNVFKTSSSTSLGSKVSASSLGAAASGGIGIGGAAAGSTASRRTGPPPGASLKERVAFFDAAA